MLDEKTIEQIKKIQGQVRGVVFCTDKKYILDTKGQEGLAKIDAKFKKITGSSVYQDKIDATGWYPLSWRVLSLLIIQETFTWGEKEIADMGMAAPKNSFVVKVLLRYFVSMEKSFAESAKYWQKHYSIGKLKATEINTKEKKVILQLTDFKGHPYLCSYLRGYFK